MVSCLQLACAGISLIGIATATTSLPFDCSADYTDCWECLLNHWSQAKFDYCCKHEKKGCGPVKSASRELDPVLEGVDCGGEVIRGIAVDADAEQVAVVASCRTACFQDNRCGAWSLNHSSDGQQGLRRCWLHRDCGDRKTDDKAISGLMSRGGAAQVSTTTTKQTTTHVKNVPIEHVEIPKEMPPNGLDGVLVDSNCWGQDLVEIAIKDANHNARIGKGNLVVAACRQACVDHAKQGCVAWTLNYGSAGMQGRGHCWLKAACTRREKDTRAISGRLIEKETSKDAKVIDGGDALKRMEERSQQTKKIVGGVVGAGVGALAVGILGGVLGKRATDAQAQQLREQQAGGVGGTRGMGGNLGTGQLDGLFGNGNMRGSSAGTASGGVTDRSASGLDRLANGSANGTAADSGDAALVVPDTSPTGVDNNEHTLMWWWIPLLLLAAALLCLGIWCLRKKAAAAKSARGFKGKNDRKRSAASGSPGMNINIPASPASSACSEAPMLEDVRSPKAQQMRSCQVGVQQSASPVGGDLFDAIDANHDGVIDKEEFERAMHGVGGSAAMYAGGSASMVAGGSASMLAGGSTTYLRQQQRRAARSVTPPRLRPGSPRGTWMVYEGASATMSVGGSACMSPGASVSVMPTSASFIPSVTTSYVPSAASVSIMPPTTTVVTPSMGTRRLFTTTTVSSPSRSRGSLGGSQMRSLTPPPSFGSSFGRQSLGLTVPQLRTPPML